MSEPAPVAEFVVVSRGPAATRRLGERIAGLLREGDVVALEGPLGAGKTELVRGIAAGLDVDDPREVSSPSFQLVRPYAGRFPIYHVDGYRLSDEEEMHALGLLEPVHGRGVLLVEWARRLDRTLPAERLAVTLAITGARTRRISLVGRGASWADRVRSLASHTIPGTKG